MIRRPTKKIGGTIGEEFDAVWEALARTQVVASSSVQVDQTTRGTVIRVKTDDAAADSPCGAFFKISNWVGLGNVFNAKVRDSDGVELVTVLGGAWGTGNKMLSPYSRVDPKGLSLTPTFDTEDHVLLWELPPALVTLYPSLGDIVFAVRTSFDNCFTGYTTDWEPIYGAKVAWRVISTTAAPIVIESGSVAITLTWPQNAPFVLGDPVTLGADLDTTTTNGAFGKVEFIANGGTGVSGGRIILADVGTSNVSTTMEADMEFGVTVKAYNADGRLGDTDSIAFYIDPAQTPPTIDSMSFSPDTIGEGTYTDLTINYSGLPTMMEIAAANGMIQYSGGANHDGSGVVVHRLMRIPYDGGNGTWTAKLSNDAGESSGSAILNVTPY